jgi:hypothetical protein
MKRYRLRNLRLTRVDRVPAGSNPDAHIVLFKAADELTASDPTLASNDTVEVAMSDETTAEDVAKHDDPESPLATTLDGGDEAHADVATAAESVEAPAAAEVDKALDDARAEIAKMQRAAREGEFIAKAKADFDNLGDATELGGLLLDAADLLSADTYQLLERTLKAANARVGEGDLFKQIGDPGAAPVEAKATIYKMAEEMVAKGEAKNLGLALAEVARLNPELRDEYYSAAERA